MPLLGCLRARAALAILLIFVVAARAACGEVDSFTAGLSPAERELLVEYATSYERLVSIYDNIYIEAIRRVWETGGNGPRREILTSLTYRANGGAFFRMDAVPLNPQDNSPIGKATVNIIRPREGLVVAERARMGSPFAVTGLTPSGHKGLWADYYFQEAPYTAFGLDLKFVVLKRPDFLKNPRIEAIVSRSEGTERFVSVDVGGVGIRSGRDWHGHFVFFRDRNWALKEARFGLAKLVAPNDDNHACRCEYQVTDAGVPLLKRAECWFEVGPTRACVSAKRFEVREIIPGPVPEDEFSLAAIGIQLGGDGAAHRISRLIGVLSTLLLLLAVVVIWLRFRNRISRTRRDKKNAASGGTAT